MDWIDLVQDRDHLRALVCRILVAKPEGKRPTIRPRYICMDNIKMHLTDTGLGGMDRTDLTLDRNKLKALVYTVMNFRVP
jgi:hypothetical protein